MMELDQLVLEAWRPVELGHVITPLRTIIGGIRRTRARGDALYLYTSLRNLLRLAAPMLSAAERATLDGEIRGLDGRGVFERERAALLECLAEPAVDPVSFPIGSAQLLLVSTEPFRGEPFGIARPLDIQASPAGGVSKLENPASAKTVFESFQLGIDAARDLALRLGPGTMSFAQVVHAYSFIAAVRGLPHDLPVEGPSMALGTALAAISHLLSLPLPADAAFTGRLDLRGTLYPVAGIRPKLVAAAEKGIRRAFVPFDNRGDVPAEVRSVLDVVAAQTLEKVVERVFGAETVRDRLRELVARVRPPEGLKQQGWIIADLGAERRRRILLTFVGKTDPYGQYVGRDRTPLETPPEEGPALSMVRMLRPDAVYLLHTCEPRGEDNDLTPNAEATERFLSLEGREVRRIPMPSITDPSDWDVLRPAIDALIDDVAATEPPASIDWFVNLTSGTKQMYGLWCELRGRGRLKAHLLETREGRWARQPGETRFREVVASTRS